MVLRWGLLRGQRLVCEPTEGCDPHRCEEPNDDCDDTRGEEKARPDPAGLRAVFLLAILRRYREGYMRPPARRPLSDG